MVMNEQEQHPDPETGVYIINICTLHMCVFCCDIWKSLKPLARYSSVFHHTIWQVPVALALQNVLLKQQMLNVFACREQIKQERDS